MVRGRCLFEPVFDTVGRVGPLVNAELAREHICSALDAIDAAHEALRQTPSEAVGNAIPRKSRAAFGSLRISGRAIR